METFLCHSEVEDGQLDADFRAVMRSRHLCRDKELEVLAIVERPLSELDQNLAALLLDLL